MEKDEKLEPGNTPDSFEREEVVAGKTVTVQYEDADFTKPFNVVPPEDLEEKELETWSKEAHNEVKMKRSSSDKYAEAAQKERELQRKQEEWEEERKQQLADIEKQKKDLEKRSASKIDEPDFNKILSDISGKPISSDADAAKMLEDDPLSYHNANKQYHKELAQSSLKSVEDKSISRATELLMKNKVEGEKINWSKFKAFADSNGMAPNDRALHFFKLENKPTDIAATINKGNPATKEITFLPRGDVKPAGSVKTLEEEYPSQYDLENFVTKERRKPWEKQDPRVRALFPKKK